MKGLPKDWEKKPFSRAGSLAALAVVLATSCSRFVPAPDPVIPPLTGPWAFLSGSSTRDAAGSYGVLNTPAPANQPGARYGAASWKDSLGNFWMFGGYGYGTGSSPGLLNDLWKWDGTNWTWVSGASSTDSVGVYGTQGVAAAANIPGARKYAATWIDASNNLWLFGGQGFDTAASGFLNDLWKWDGTNWTWVSGANAANQAGSYGTINVAAAANIPGSRYGAAGWRDAGGNLWLLGGYGFDWENTVSGYLNDLWEWDGANWTWKGGAYTLDSAGAYGTLGVAASGNAPGARAMASIETISTGNVYLFGGSGHDASGALGDLSDLWLWNGTQWAWISGPSTVNGAGTYGTQGTASASGQPGSRYAATAWIDSSDFLWLFGGSGHDVIGTGGELQDLWKWDGAQWTWVAGSAYADAAGVYSAQGVASPRDSACGWIDASNRLWLFGGTGLDSSGRSGLLNDFWKL